MTIDYMLKRLDILQKASANYAMREKKVEELKVMMEADMKLITSIREEFLQLADEEKEEPDPNADPEEVPPVTDLENVVDKTPGWALAKRMGKKVKLVNRFTGEEKEFPTKTKCCEFLGISAISLQRDIDRDGKHGEWSILVDTPTA